MSRILGIDVGEKKIGLAIGDTGSNFAFARPPLLVNDWSVAWPILTQLVIDEHIDTVVIGLPLKRDGQPGSQAERTRVFIDQLRQHCPVPIVEQDERLTTKAVTKEQSKADRKLPRGYEDSLAAQLIVETYLIQHRV